MAGNAHLQQVGEAGVSVGHVALRAALDIHQGHDDEAEGAEGLIDAGGLAQPLPRRPRRSSAARCLHGGSARALGRSHS